MVTSQNKKLKIGSDFKCKSSSLNIRKKALEKCSVWFWPQISPNYSTPQMLYAVKSPVHCLSTHSPNTAGSVSCVSLV